MEYLKAIGFVESVGDDGAKVLRVEPDVALMKSSLQEVSNGLDMVAPKDSSSATAKVVKKHRVASPIEEKKEEPKGLLFEEKLSEKQKARIMMEAKEKRERDEAKMHRKKTAALIKADKFVRENDANWTSQPSAACSKAGKGISTFRDRNGEE